MCVAGRRFGHCGRPNWFRATRAYSVGKTVPGMLRGSVSQCQHRMTSKWPRNAQERTHANGRAYAKDACQRRSTRPTTQPSDGTRRQEPPTWRPQRPCTGTKRQAFTSTSTLTLSCCGGGAFAYWIAHVKPSCAPESLSKVSTTLGAAETEFENKSAPRPTFIFTSDIQLSKKKKNGEITAPPSAP